MKLKDLNERFEARFDARTFSDLTHSGIIKFLESVYFLHGTPNGRISKIFGEGKLLSAEKLISTGRSPKNTFFVDKYFQTYGYVFFSFGLRAKITEDYETFFLIKPSILRRGGVKYHIQIGDVMDFYGHFYMQEHSTLAKDVDLKYPSKSYLDDEELPIYNKELKKM